MCGGIFGSATNAYLPEAVRALVSRRSGSGPGRRDYVLGTLLAINHYAIQSCTLHSTSRHCIQVLSSWSRQSEVGQLYPLYPVAAHGSRHPRQVRCVHQSHACRHRQQKQQRLHHRGSRRRTPAGQGNKGGHAESASQSGMLDRVCIAICRLRLAQMLKERLKDPEKEVSDAED
jgi:hypothetical protein